MKSNPKFRRTVSVTLPHFKTVYDTPRFYKFVGAIYQGDKANKHDDENAAMPPPMLAKVCDLETGELGLIIVPTVMKNELLKHYPDDKYVGKCFEVTLTKPPVGTSKRYSLVTMFEVAEPDEPMAADAPPPPTSSNGTASATIGQAYAADETSGAATRQAATAHPTARTRR